MSVRSLLLLSLLLLCATPVWPDDGKAVPKNIERQQKRADEHLAAGRTDDAIRAYRQVVEQLRARDDQSETLLFALTDLTAAYARAKQDKEALPVWDETLALARRLYPADHYERAVLLNNLGQALVRLGQYDKALVLQRECLAMSRRLMPEDGDDLVTALDSVALTLHKLSHHEEALPLQREALAMAKRLAKGDRGDVARCAHRLANTLMALDRYEEALPVQESVVATARRLFGGRDHPKLATALGNLGTTLGELGRFDEALQTLGEAHDMRRRLMRGPHPEIAAGMRQRAATLRSMGRWQEALDWARRALTVTRLVFEGDHPDVAESLDDLATTYDGLGRSVDALPLRQEALAMRQRIHPSAHDDVATSLANVAFTLSHLGEYQEALLLQKESAQVTRQLHKTDNDALAVVTDNIGSTYSAMGLRAEALASKQEALAMRRRMYPGDHKAVALSLNNVAAQLSLADRPAEALPLNVQSLEMYQRLLGKNHESVALALANTARVYLALGALSEAEALAREAVDVGGRVGWARTYIARDVLAGVLLHRGDAKAALTVLTPAAEAFEGTRRAAAVLGASGRSTYTSALRRWDPFLPMMRAHVIQNDPAAALAVLERSRGREMLDLLAQSQLDPLEAARAHAAAAKDTAALERLDEAQRAVTAARQASASAERRAQRAQMSMSRKKLRDARERQVAANKRVRLTTRARLRLVRELIPEGRPLEVAAIRALLQDDERLLAYVLGQHSYLFVVSRESVAVHTLASHESITELARKYLATLRQPGTTPRTAKGHPGAALFAETVPATAWRDIKDARRLYVLPHGILNLVPFEALVTGESDGVPRYWMEAGPPIAYATSASVLATLASRPPRAIAAGPIVALGDPVFDRKGLSPLPGTRTEIEAIASLASATASRPSIRLLHGEGATERALFDAAPAAAVLHVATHGLADAGSGPALVLTPGSRGDATNDGLLRLRDLLEGWRTRLDGMSLVVLSACESHAGTYEANEGMFALPWGFCFAGARSCIASLWRVDDRSTAQLMTALYRDLLDPATTSPCTALQAARKTVFRSSPDPYYWAPFIFFGAP